jgi:DNA integrity scanning protein DisA with diadenylate cyclase activity
MQSTFNNTNSMAFNKSYFLLALALFITEVLIGTYMHDAIIRPYGGDFLVVILIYCIVKSFLNLPVLQTACYVLIFAYAVEISQYFHLVNLLGLQNNSVAKILLGTFFSITDLLAYTLGILLVIVSENIRKRAAGSLITR